MSQAFNLNSFGGDYVDSECDAGIDYSFTVTFSGSDGHAPSITRSTTKTITVTNSLDTDNDGIISIGEIQNYNLANEEFSKFFS